MTYDAARAAVLLFGGQDESARLSSDTWAWDGATWRRVAEIGPQGRAHFGLVFDRIHGQVSLYGGYDGAVYEDFWSWDGQDWTALDFPGPGPRSHLGMAFDDQAGTLAIFGGATSASTMSSLTDDLWVLDNGRWSRTGVSGPSARGSPGMAYDSARKRIVLYGGFDETGDVLSDTWEWDGRAWSCAAACPG
jgi:hypothetical protein